MTIQFKKVNLNQQNIDLLNRELPNRLEEDTDSYLLKLKATEDSGKLSLFLESHNIKFELDENR